MAIGAGSTVQVRHGALLSNHGVVTVLAEGLQLEGSFTNTPVGTVNVDETGGGGFLLRLRRYVDRGHIQQLHQPGHSAGAALRQHQSPVRAGSGGITMRPGRSTAGNIAVGPGPPLSRAVAVSSARSSATTTG